MVNIVRFIYCYMYHSLVIPLHCLHIIQFTGMHDFPRLPSLKHYSDQFIIIKSPMHESLIFSGVYNYAIPGAFSSLKNGSYTCMLKVEKKKNKTCRTWEFWHIVYYYLLDGLHVNTAPGWKTSVWILSPDAVWWKVMRVLHDMASDFHLADLWQYWQIDY